MFKLLAVGVCTTALLCAQGGFGGSGTYVITNLKSGKAMEVDRGDQTTIVQAMVRDVDNQVWRVERAACGFFFIRSVMGGKALQITSDAKSTPVIVAPFDKGPGQQWRLEPGKDGNILIISANGRVLDIPNGSPNDGVRVQIYERNGDSNQRFIFRRVTKEPPRKR